MKLSKKLIYPWIIVLCCCAMATASIGIAVNCMGVYYQPIANELNVGLGSVSLYLTILNLTCGFFGPMVIKLTQKMDIRVMLAIGGFGNALAYVGLANANALWQIYGLALLQGVLTSLSGMVLVNTLVSNWFDKAMGIASGLAMCFSGLMGAVLSPVFNSIIQSAGWRTSYYIAAIIVAGCFIPALIFVRLRPSDIGLPRFGRDEVQAPVNIIVGEKKERGNSVFRSLVFILLVILGFCVAFITGIGSHISNYATSVGIESSVAALMISAVMIGNMSSKLIAGVLCDVMGPKRAILLIFAVAILGITLLLFPSLGIVAAMIGSVGVGCSYSIPTVGISNISRDIFGVENFGAAYPYVSMSGFIGSALSFAAIGYSYDIFGSFTPAIVFCIAIAILSVFCVLTVYKKVKR